MPGRIDYNRGILKKKDNQTQITVIAFKDDPGNYFDERGQPVSNDLARAAGHDVETGARERRRRELKAESDKKIDKQLREEDAKIDAQIQQEAAKAAKNDGGEERTQAGTDMKAIHRGGGKWWVVNKAGEPLSEGLTKEEATKFISDAAGEAAEEA